MARQAKNVDVDVQPNVARKPKVSVIERRKKDPNFRAQSVIELKEPGYTVRWGNTGLPNRHHQLVYTKGWEPVLRSEIKDLNQIADLTDQGDGLVRRGERGREVLYKMRTDDYREVKMNETRLRKEAGRNKAKVRDEVAQAAAGKFGDEAGDFIAGEHSGPIKPILPTLNEGVERLGAEDLEG